eukprot:Gb_20657 [translate_table: standard]
MAKLIKKVECYDEMVKSMNKVIRYGVVMSTRLDVELSVKEKNFVSVGYRNVISVRRISWKIMSSIEREAKGNEHSVNCIKYYRNKVEGEFSIIYNNILTIINEHLILFSSIGESTIFYYKMKGDYYQYLA